MLCLEHVKKKLILYIYIYKKNDYYNRRILLGIRKMSSHPALNFSLPSIEKRNLVIVYTKKNNVKINITYNNIYSKHIVNLTMVLVK